jgi:hypothetical protein
MDYTPQTDVDITIVFSVTTQRILSFRVKRGILLHWNIAQDHKISPFGRNDIKNQEVQKKYTE